MLTSAAAALGYKEASCAYRGSTPYCEGLDARTLLRDLDLSRVPDLERVLDDFISGRSDILALQKQRRCSFLA